MRPGSEIVRVVVVKQQELEAYTKFWPDLTFLSVSTPRDKNVGVGYSRFVIQKFADLVCPPEFRYFMMMDDNIPTFSKIRLTSDPGIFCGQSCITNVPLDMVLGYFDNDEFDDRDKFAMLGFHRCGARSDQTLANPYSRSHVYSAVIFNINKLQELECFFGRYRLQSESQ